MVSNLSWFHEHQHWDVQSSKSHDFSAISHSQHQNKQIFTLSIQWAGPTSFSSILAKGNRIGKFSFETGMWVNYTHQRSCSKCQTESWDWDGVLGWRGKKRNGFLFLRVFVMKKKTKERCNKYFQLTIFHFSVLWIFLVFFISGWFFFFLFAWWNKKVLFFWDIKQARRLGYCATLN